MGWQDLDKVKPKHTDDYNVACIVGSIMGCYRTVRTYRYEIRNGKGGRTEKWCIPDNFNEIVEITHWQSLPFLPEDPEWDA